MKLPALPYRIRAAVRGMLLTALLGLESPGSAQTPALQAVRDGAGSVRLAWTNTAPGYVLEETRQLAAAPVWSAVLTPAVDATQTTTWTVSDGLGERYYRLRANENTGPTTIASTSPADREPGVSVNREVVLNFSRPLAANAVVSTTNFFAGVSGRKFLARVELSSDRRKASLFFLEPVRGGTRLSVVFDGSSLRDDAGRLIDADGDGQEGGSRVISYDTFSTASVAGTAVFGRVFASELMPGSDTGTNAVNRPLAGVTITVDGAEETLRAVTDAQGYFKLTNAPAGRFFVHIDGRTSPLSRWPGGDYYPFVGKAWEAMAGRDDNPAGGTGLIYLPLISANTLQPTSLTQDTVIGFPADVLAKNPALAGVSLTVPAGSLFDDNGNRGGQVGIAPVPPDRLPGPLPNGLTLPLVITVQTDGAQNFDRPVPICFPNLPDANGFLALPGMGAALMSFDHDTGEWRVAGSMTVSDDGRFICTDPGSGISKPGWHGTDSPNPQDHPGAPPPPSPPPPPPPPPICEDPSNQSDTASAARSQITRHSGECVPCDGNAQFQNRKKCKVRCNEDAIVDCLLTVGSGWAVCAATSGGIASVPCAAAAAAAEIPCLLIKRDICRSRCDEDNPPCGGGGPSGAASRQALPQRHDESPADKKFAEIEELVVQLGTLAEPYLNNPDSMPADLVAQAEQIIHQINSLCGGNLKSYLEAELLRKESEAVSELGADEEYFGYQPDRPMFLKAEYRRQSVRLACKNGIPEEFRNPPTEAEIRFRSEPKGQYLVYLDGVSQREYLEAKARINGCNASIGLTIAELQRVVAYDPVAHVIAYAYPRQVPGLASGISGFVPQPLFALLPDSDHDGLPDEAEDIVGTDPENPDSDGDSVPDGAELDQGSNPLDGRPASVGIQANVRGTGTAYDVAAFNQVAVTAEGIAGVSFFNVAGGYNPVFTGTVPLPGDSRAVALGNGFAAVGAGTGGLAIVGVDATANATLRHTVHFNAPVGAVAAIGNLAAAGTDAGEVILLEALSGTVLSRAQTGQRVHDLGFTDGHLFVLTDGNLAVFRPDGEELVPVTTVPHGNGFQVESITNRRRLAVGGGLAWITGYPGYGTLSITNPAVPLVLGAAQDYGPNSFKQLAPTGSGYGVATVGRVPSNLDPRTHNVQLFDLRNPEVSTNVITQFDTPGLARAVALYGGFAYVADSDAGLEVMSYLPFDTGTNAPTIKLATGAPGPVLEAGQTLGLTATVEDDVQVREVEFYLNGQRVLVDGGFPFEVAVQLPVYDPIRTNVTMRARAIDTGGNTAWSEELRFGLVPDATPPRVIRRHPPANSVRGNVESVSIRFNEPVELESLRSGFTVVAVGATVTQPVPGALSLRGDGTSAFLTFGEPLPPGRYQVRLAAGVTDVSGNATLKDLRWDFSALDGVDQDQDGLLDQFEALNGFDPTRPDQNNNGAPDGDDDADSDGVPNYVEMLLGLNPRDAFSFPPTRDNELDRDGDYLPDGREAALGTDPLKPDTDGDRFTDEAEVTAGSNPLDLQSYPLGARPGPTTVQVLNLSPDGLFVFGRPSLEAVIVSTANWAPFTYGRPPVEVIAVGRTPDSAPFAFSRPPIDAVVLSTAALKPFVLGKPPVEVFAPGRSTNSLPPFFYGRPEIEVRDE